MSYGPLFLARRVTSRRCIKSAAIGRKADIRPGPGLDSNGITALRRRPEFAALCAARPRCPLVQRQTKTLADQPK
jgi:hypothetical protein